MDGTLTDGGIILGPHGESKRFDVQDGMGIRLAQLAQIHIAVITGRSSEVVRDRALELGIEDLYQGVVDKTQVLDHLLTKYGLSTSQIAYIGDDLGDVPIMKKVGLPIAVNNAISEVKEHSLYVTDRSGGYGAVREAIDWILDLKGQKEAIYKQVM